MSQQDGFRNPLEVPGQIKITNRLRQASQSVRIPAGLQSQQADGRKQLQQKQKREQQLNYHKKQNYQKSRTHKLCDEDRVKELTSAEDTKCSVQYESTSRLRHSEHPYDPKQGMQVSNKNTIKTQRGGNKTRLTSNQKYLLQRIEKLVSTIQEYAYKLGQVQTANSEAIRLKQQQIISLKAQISKITKLKDEQIHNLRVSLKKQQKLHQQTLSNSTREAEREVQSKLVPKLHRKMNALSNLKYRNQCLEQTVALDKELIQELQTEMLMMNQKLIRLNEESMKEYVARIQYLEAENESLKEEKQEIMENYNRVSQEAEELKEQLRTSCSKYKEDIEELAAIVQDQMKKLEQSQRVIEQRQGIIDSLEAQLNQGYQEISKIKKELTGTIETYGLSLSPLKENGVQVELKPSETQTMADQQKNWSNNTCATQQVSQQYNNRYTSISIKSVALAVFKAQARNSYESAQKALKVES